MQSFIKKCVYWQHLTTFVKIFASNLNHVFFYVWILWANCRLKYHKCDCDLFFQTPDSCQTCALVCVQLPSRLAQTLCTAMSSLFDCQTSLHHRGNEVCACMSFFFFSFSCYACVGYFLKQRRTVIFSSKAEFSSSTWLNLVLPEHLGKSPTYCTHSSRLLPPVKVLGYFHLLG